jgi:hypothetical protein
MLDLWKKRWLDTRGGAIDRSNATARVLAGLIAVFIGGCATMDPTPHIAHECPGPMSAAVAPDGWSPAPGAVLRGTPIDPAVEERILALDPEHVSEDDVRSTLACGPTPQIMNVHGGIYPVHLAMQDFAGFLIDMGYPARRVREPGRGTYSYSPYQSSEKLAGKAAWFYEQQGTRVMLIGHSQGGMQVVKVLHELDGGFDESVRVFDPLEDKVQQRTWIIDPLTGARRSVVGISVAYASAVGAGGVAFLLPNQWIMVNRLRRIPNTTDAFTGYFLEFDMVAWSTPGSAEYDAFRHNGTAVVRNVSLPGHYNHVTLPATRRFAEDKALRDWINRYTPDATLPPPPAPAAGSDNGLLWATDVWYSVKKHWVLEAQRVIRARRDLPSSLPGDPQDPVH